ncbi:uncharacterized protein NPIL_27401 [Nephila pilipes]|uniref:Ig-like domain-containing protein n=1 Tax=Nephila pilipes TaxID=299642 RepID=A0A8X6P5N8_NEPPI|nr:uncharacterized protein NPIL_27401 [Nephila pilipes]
MLFGEEKNDEKKLEGVPLLNGRTERSHEQEAILVEPRGRPNGHLDDAHFLPYFDDAIETNVTYQVSKTAYLHCSIRQLGDRMVSWVRQTDLHILTVGTYTYTTDQRFTSIHMENTDDWTLQLRDTRKKDSGVYECQVSTEPKMSLAIQLNIIVVEAYISEGPILYIKRGSPVNLTCHVKDQVGTVFLFWYYNGKVLNAEEKKQRGIDVFTELGQTTISRLFIAKAKLSDTGNYSCQPSYADPANITLQVLSGEKPAAMQHGRQNSGWVNPASFLLVALLSFSLLM